MASITPFVSYLEALAAQQAARAGEVLLLHGCRGRADHPPADRLEVLAPRIPGLRRITAYSRPDAEDRAAGRFEVHGRLDIDALRAAGALPDDPDDRPLAYICGSPAFVADMREGLVRWGMPRFDIFTEAFYVPAEVPPELEPRRITVAGSGQSFAWTPGGGSILDAALAAGIALRSGCESCAVAVVEGRFAHLVPVEGEPGTCLACQAVPLADLTIAP